MCHSLPFTLMVLMHNIIVNSSAFIFFSYGLEINMSNVAVVIGESVFRSHWLVNYVSIS